MFNLKNLNNKITLHPLREVSILNLMFLPEHDNFFRVNSDASDKEKSSYVDFLLKASAKRLSCEVRYSGIVVGFIMVAGVDNRLVGGILPKYKRKGIYSNARNAVINLLNRNGIFNIVYSVDDSNTVMKKFSANQLSTPLEGGLSIAHYNPNRTEAFISPKVKLGTGFKEYRGKLYHISFDNNLPKTLKPKLPDGYNKSSTSKFTEFNKPRVSFAPSPELCFRAIYPNISKLLEGINEKSIEFNLYCVKDVNWKKFISPKELIEDNLVHDAHITLEHTTLSEVDIQLVGKVVFKNTSDDDGLYYIPFVEDNKSKYHSPRQIIKL